MFGESHFIALLEYKSTEEGGRKTAASSGYRPHIKFPFDEYMTSGIQLFIDTEFVLPGESVSAIIRILSTEYFEGKLYEGLEFVFCEGSRTIGTGKITEIINPKLKHNFQE
ncbi:hypothetical protein [Flavobacterium sp. 2]|uniref:EF-Tu C-terminal domain-related protein n=1 Tax=Flavobacterium sp. 2 TaxID=308053 RepID=UPI003CF15E10